LVVFALALPFIVALAFLKSGKHQTPAADAPMPNPNGYEQFIKAAGMLQGDAGRCETMGATELAAFVSTNAEALAVARSAFTNECRLPVQYSIS